MSKKYVHGYDDVEQERLHLQAGVLEKMTYENLDFSGIEHLLEMGCGTGGQTEILLRRYPYLKITSVDYSEEQLIAANRNLSHISHKVNFILGDITQLSFEDASFDGVFICWVLEHTTNPLAVLKEAYRLLKPGGKIFITEVHNDSFKTFPRKEYAHAYMEAFNELQIEMGGDPHIGIKLGYHLDQAGFTNIRKQSLHQLHDNSDQNAKANFVTYFKNLYLSAAEELIKCGKIDNDLLQNMIADFEELINEGNGIYYYSPIQAVAEK